MILSNLTSPATLWARYYAALRDAAAADVGAALAAAAADVVAPPLDTAPRANRSAGAVDALPRTLHVAKPRRRVTTRTAKEASR